MHDRKILIDYYQGSYGPVIRIDTQAAEEIIQIKNIFMELILTEVTEIRLHTDEQIKMVGMKALVLRLIPAGQERQKTLNLAHLTSEGPIFHWSKSAEGWEDCVGLLDGILKYDRPSHQYLTEEGIDDALVEVAFLEAK